VSAMRPMLSHGAFAAALASAALVPFDVIRPTEPDFWTLPLEKVMILSRGTSFSAEDQHDIDPHALSRLWM
jgi:hypothetical protein